MLWNKSVETGHAAIDKDHKELFNLVEQILGIDSSTTMLTIEKRSEKINSVVNFLGEYVGRHFKLEEDLMDKYGYPDSSKHKKMHSDFIQTFVDLKKKISEEGSTLSISLEVNKVIVTWLKEHIMGADKTFADYLRNQE